MARWHHLLVAGRVTDRWRHLLAAGPTTWKPAENRDTPPPRPRGPWDQKLRTESGAGGKFGNCYLIQLGNVT